MRVKLISLAAALLLAGPAGAAAPLRPLQTAILDPETFAGPNAATAFARTAAAGATAVRLAASWQQLAPATPPKGFDPTDPNDPAYRWAPLDRQVELAVKYHLEPLVSVQSAPAWALRAFAGHARPDPVAYGAFATALAHRYDGSVEGIPKVTLWQAWNEPNKVSGPALKRSAPAWYRAMANSFAAAIHEADPANVVVAGGLSPFGIRTAVSPLLFMRSLLCLNRALEQTCTSPVHFDVWSAHPYTAGGPTHHAYYRDDVSIGDLPKMRQVLTAALRLHHVVSARPVRFWVTEFGWDTKPPDPKGVPMTVHARWVAEALYRMWSDGITLVTWYLLRDEPRATSVYQSGFYFRGASLAGDRAKLSLAAFRFPFVALRDRGAFLVWGRTPKSTAGTVFVQQQVGRRWQNRLTLRANAFGIFTGRVLPKGSGSFRARLASGTPSLAFAQTGTEDLAVQPFGS